MGLRPRRTGSLLAVAVITALMASVVPGRVGAVAMSGATTADPNGDWPVAGHDLGNTRDAPGERMIGPGNASRLAVAWSITTSGQVAATPTVADGIVYFPDFGGTLWAVAAGTGQVIWSRPVSSYTGYPDASRTSPAVYGDELIFGDTSFPEHGAVIFGVNRFTGALLWKTPVDTHPASISTGSPVVYRGVVYLGVSSNEEVDAAFTPGYQCCTFRGSVMALDAATGKILWKTYTVPPGYAGGAVWGSTPVIDPADHMLYVGTGNNYSVPAGVCLSPDQAGCAPPASDDHVDSVLALDLATGAIRWFMPTLTSDVFTDVCGLQPDSTCGPDFDFGSGPNLIRLPAGRQLLGIGQKSGVYWALDPRTGAVVWRTLVGPGGEFGGIEWGSATDGRHIYVAVADYSGLPYQITSSDGRTSITDGGSWAELDAATGKILWQVADPQQAADLGYVSIGGGLVYAGSTAATGTNMYVLDARDGDILWRFASGGPVAAGAAIAGGTVYWGFGYDLATRCPGGTGAIQVCFGVGSAGMYAFRVGS